MTVLHTHTPAILFFLLALSSNFFCLCTLFFIRSAVRGLLKPLQGWKGGRGGAETDCIVCWSA